MKVLLEQNIIVEYKTQKRLTYLGHNVPSNSAHEIKLKEK